MGVPFGKVLLALDEGLAGVCHPVAGTGLSGAIARSVQGLVRVVSDPPC